jgi:hypothetical protein
MISLLLAPTLIMIPVMPGNCADRVPQAMPAAMAGFGANVEIHQQPLFFFREGTSEHLRLVQTNADRGAAPLIVTLSAEEGDFVAEGIRFKPFSVPELPLQTCFGLQESPDGIRPFFASAIYRNSICVTKEGAPAAAELAPPRLSISASNPTFGSGSGSFNQDNDLFREQPCHTRLNSGSGNIELTIDSISTTPSVLQIELLKDGELAQSREMLMHEAILQQGEQVTARFLTGDLNGLSLRVTLRGVDGSTSDPVEIAVPQAGGCHNLSVTSLFLLLGLVGLRRRRQLA